MSSVGLGRTARHIVFLSHVREDLRQCRSFARLLTVALEGQGYSQQTLVWLDETSWVNGQKPLEVIREAIHESEFVLVWATPHYFSNTRGWAWMELAYAEMDQYELNARLAGGRFCPLVLPVFRKVTVADVARTHLLNYWLQNLDMAFRPRPLPELARVVAEACATLLLERQHLLP